MVDVLEQERPRAGAHGKMTEACSMPKGKGVLADELNHRGKEDTEPELEKTGGRSQESETRNTGRLNHSDPEDTEPEPEKTGVVSTRRSGRTRW